MGHLFDPLDCCSSAAADGDLADDGYKTALGRIGTIPSCPFINNILAKNITCK